MEWPTKKCTTEEDDMMNSVWSVEKLKICSKDLVYMPHVSLKSAEIILKSSPSPFLQYYHAIIGRMAAYQQHYGSRPTFSNTSIYKS